MRPKGGDRPTANWRTRSPATSEASKVVGVLPGIDHEQGNSALAGSMLIVDLARQEALGDRLVDERAPARAHHRGRDLGELRFVMPMKKIDIATIEVAIRR
jgi:hypothetical protein